MQSAIPSIVGVSVKVDDFQTFQEFASYLYNSGILQHDDVADLMLYATKFLLQKTKEMAARDRAQRAPRANQRPEQYMSAAVSELDSFSTRSF